MADYSKNRVDGAGRVLAERIKTPTESDVAAQVLDWWGSEPVRIVDWWRSQHVRPLSTVAANLFRYVSDEGDPVVAQRLKRVPTIAAKLARGHGMRLSQMEDIGGVRAVLPSQAAAYRVARRLKRNWTITRSRDYVVSPKPDGYRALHLVNRNRGRLIEIQLRTSSQDLWANSVEGAEQRFPGFKAGGGPQQLREFFVVASEIFAIMDGSAEISPSRLPEFEEVIAKAGDYLGASE
jgi:hypothetical protein